MTVFILDRVSVEDPVVYVIALFKYVREHALAVEAVARIHKIDPFTACDLNGAVHRVINPAVLFGNYLIGNARFLKARLIGGSDLQRLVRGTAVLYDIFKVFKLLRDNRFYGPFQGLSGIKADRYD